MSKKCGQSHFFYELRSILKITHFHHFTAFLPSACQQRPPTYPPTFCWMFLLNDTVSLSHCHTQIKDILKMPKWHVTSNKCHAVTLTHCHIKKQNAKNIKITYVKRDCHAVTLLHQNDQKSLKYRNCKLPEPNVTLSHQNIFPKNAKITYVQVTIALSHCHTKKTKNSKNAKITYVKKQPIPHCHQTFNWTKKQKNTLTVN
jgi:hypothetical protein